MGGNGFFARSVSIIGAGYTPLGDVRSTPQILDFSEKELYAMACIEAMETPVLMPATLMPSMLAAADPMQIPK